MWVIFYFRQLACLYFFINIVINLFESNGPLAQSLERGANNGKVVCSRLIRTRFHFLFGLVSLFK